MNEAFYEEEFKGCQSLEEVAEAVEKRAVKICEQQKELKGLAYFPVNSDRTRSKSFTESDHWLDSYSSGDEIICSTYGRPDVTKSEEVNADNASNQEEKRAGFKEKIKNLRKWCKKVFLPKRKTCRNL